MGKKTKIIAGVVVVAIIVVAGVMLGGSEKFQGKLELKKQTTATKAAANASWATALIGKTTDSTGKLTLSPKLTWEKAHSYLAAGKDFKVAIKAAAGGGDGYQSYPCANVLLEDGDNVFKCYGASNGYAYPAVLNLRFDADGSVYYFENDGAFAGTREVKVATTGSTWTTALEGNVTDDTGKLTIVSAPMNWEKAKSFVWAEKDFKVVVDAAAGGGSGSQSYTCANVVLEGGDNIFRCYGANNAYNYASILTLRFDANGDIYYLSNTPEITGTMKIKVFTK